MGKKYPTDHVTPSMTLEEYEGSKNPKVRKVYGPRGEVWWLDENNERVDRPGSTTIRN